MKVKKTLTEIMENQTITNQFDFTGACPDKDGVSQTFTIFNTNFFLNEIEHNFFNRVAFVNEENSFTDLTTMFTRWAYDRGPMYARLAYAYSLGYNPIENYSSVEKHTGTDTLENGKKITHTWDDDTLTHAYDSNDPLKVERAYDSVDPLKVERAYDSVDPLKVERLYDADNPLNIQHAYDADDPLMQTHLYDDDNPVKITTGHTNDKETVTYNNVQDVSEHDKYGINSSSAVHQDKNTNTRSGSQDTEYSGTRTETTKGQYSDTTTGKYNDTTTGKYSDTTTGTYTDTHSGSYEDEASGNDITRYNSTLTKSGNIGVMTPAQMIQSEYDALQHQDLALRAVWDFLDRFTFYSEGLDVW